LLSRKSSWITITQKQWYFERGGVWLRCFLYKLKMRGMRDVIGILCLTPQSPQLNTSLFSTSSKRNLQGDGPKQPKPSKSNKQKQVNYSQLLFFTTTALWLYSCFCSCDYIHMMTMMWRWRAMVIALSLCLFGSVLALAATTSPGNQVNAIIIGGSSGMGKAAAVEIVKNGGKALLVSRSASKLEKAREIVAAAAYTANGDSVECQVRTKILDA